MVNKRIRRPSQKPLLFEKAAELVAKNGVDSLTIENLASAAGVTKGGVQYHFHTKDALVIELLTHLLELFDKAVSDTAGPDASGAAWLRAYVNVSLKMIDQSDGVAAALLSAMPPNDPRAEPFRIVSSRWRTRCQTGVRDKPLAQIIRLATDSVWMEFVYGELPMEKIQPIRLRLLKMIETLQ